jgi:tetratricopeptide (TPR) repeat protein
MMAMMGGDLPRARQLADEALPEARAAGARFEESRILDILGHIERKEGNTETAYLLWVESLAISRELGGWKWGDTIALINLADLASRLERYDDAETHALEALALSAETRDRSRTAFALASLALVAGAREDDRRAGTLWGAIEAEEARAPLEGWPEERPDYANRIENANSGEFESGRKAGLGFAPDEAIAYASAIARTEDN